LSKDVVAAEIRQHIISKHTEPARASDAKQLTLHAGDIHKELKYKNRMPAVCSVQGSNRFEIEARVHRTSTSGRIKVPRQNSRTRFFDKRETGFDFGGWGVRPLNPFARCAR